MNNSAAPTPAERRFVLWMWFSFWMYCLGLPFFLLFGRYVAAFLNGLPRSLVSLPPWPEAPAAMETLFWQVLGVSLMAILATLCLFIARDVRRYGPLIVALLDSKITSTLCYAALFTGSGNWAYLVGALTDGSIFVVSGALWYLAAPGDHCLDVWERRMFHLIGETLLPRRYPEGRQRCEDNLRRMLAAQGPAEQLLARLLLRALRWLPLATGFGGRFDHLSPARRVAFLEHLETSRFNPARMAALALKMYVVVPCFNDCGAAPDEQP